MICFFFQAEDGIRDLTVTGVQTCALPIWTPAAPSPSARTPTPSARTSCCSSSSTPAPGSARKTCPRSSRSEEHTSELQSQSNLVCRLLLEKKKKKDIHEKTHKRSYTR